MKKYTCVRLVLLASAASTMPAYAQGTGATAAASADSDTLATIVVTAQRRNERLQDVPIAVSAASAETLADIGSTDLTAIAAIAPAVTTAVGNGGAAITIRGVGGTGSGADESANAVYVDGVYQPNPASLLFEFNNIERVEVLKGPQGTLFGRNASGGLIQIITRTPQADPQGTFTLGYGNYNTVSASAYVTGGLADGLAIDIAANYEHQGDGWGTNFATGNDVYRGRSFGVRSKLRWDIAEGTKLTLSALYANTRLANVQGFQILPGETSFLPPPIVPVYGRNTARGFYDTNLSEDVGVATRQRNFAATLSHEFGSVTFTSITSYDASTFLLRNDADLGPAPFVAIDINSTQKSFTQELQLGSATSGPLQWVAGLFYFHSNLAGPVTAIGLSQDTGFPVSRNASAFTRTFSEAVTDSYAAYGQATIEVVPGTRLTAGLRYTKDDRYIDFARSFSDGRPTVTFPREKTGNENLGWRFAVDQKLAEDVLAYASYSRGFKSGLFNATNPGLPAVGPQTTDAYEIGLKSEFFGKRLRANISVFQNDVGGLQLRGTPVGVLTPIFYNAANGRFRGVDVELAARPFRHFNVQANVAYLHGRYGAGFSNALFFTQQPVPPGGFAQGVGDASGKTTVYSPDWVVGLTAQYEIPTSIGEFKLTGSYTYNDGFFFDPQNRVAQPSYSVANASIVWSARDNLKFRLWANNITKERYYSGSAAATFGDQYWPGTPRTYGASISWSFGK